MDVCACVLGRTFAVVARESLCVADLRHYEITEGRTASQALKCCVEEALSDKTQQEDQGWMLTRSERERFGGKEGQGDGEKKGGDKGKGLKKRARESISAALS